MAFVLRCIELVLNLVYREGGGTRVQTTSGRALVVLGGDDTYEDLFTAGRVLPDLLAEVGLVARAALGTGALAGAADADLVVLYTAAGRFDPDRQRRLADAVRDGTGLIAVHSATVLPDGAAGRIAYRLIGSRFAGHGPRPHTSRFTVWTSGTGTAAGIAPFEVEHEHYHLAMAGPATVDAWRDTHTGREPLVYRRTHGRGRVCYLQFGHDMRVWAEPSVRAIARNAARWAGRVPGSGG